MQNFLLVDDEEIFHLLGIKIFERMGISCSQIRTAMNGREAIEIIDHPALDKFPDVIFVDLNMPIMDGFEFLERFGKIRVEKRNDSKVVVLSSSNNQLDIDRAMKLGATQYLTKPLTVSMLSTVLPPAKETVAVA